jgi:hypothetical protein
MIDVNTETTTTETTDTVAELRAKLEAMTSHAEGFSAMLVALAARAPGGELFVSHGEMEVSFASGLSIVEDDDGWTVTGLREAAGVQ